MMQEDGQEMLEGNRITVVTVDPESGSRTTHVKRVQPTQKIHLGSGSILNEFT